MLARRIPSVLPPMCLEEAVDTTRVYSIAGLLPLNNPLITQRPFRSPHHHITNAGLIGGGGIPRPGELSLAHNGVLFLDDTGETVDFACAEESPYEMQLLGAYLGIYLRQVAAIVAGANLGSVHWFHIERRLRHLHVTVLPDGYYLVLVQRHPAQIATARESLRRAAVQLEREVF